MERVETVDEIIANIDKLYEYIVGGESSEERMLTTQLIRNGVNYVAYQCNGSY